MYPEGRPVVWVLPSFDLFLATFQKIPALNQLISSMLGGTKTAQQLEKGMTQLQWWTAFSTAIKSVGNSKASVNARSIAMRRVMGLPALVTKPGGKTKVSALDASAKRVEADIRKGRDKEIKALTKANVQGGRIKAWEAAQKELDTQTRLALNHERQRRAVNTWRKMLQKFKLPELHTRTLPRKVIDELKMFVRQIPFAEDRPFQTAMALLELAEIAEKKLSRYPKLDTARAWAPLIELTVNLVDKGKLPPDYSLPDSERPKEDAKVRNARKARLKEFYFGAQNDAFVQSRLALLKSLKLKLDEKLKAAQDSGFDAIAGAGTTQAPGHVQNLSGFRKFDASKPFTISGRRWRILQVLRSFRFQPATVSQAVNDLSTGGGKRVLDPLKQRGAPTSGKIEADETLLYVTLTPYKGEEQAIRVTRRTVMPGTNTLLLRQLSDDINLAAVVAQLGGLSAALEVGAEYAMDAAEFIPGGGQALAVVRITKAFAEMKSDIPEMVTALLKDPRSLINNVGAEVERRLSTDFLFDALFFGTKSFSIKTKPKEQNKKRARKFRKGKIRKILAKLLSVGRGLQNILGRLQRLVHGKRSQLQGFLLGRPTIFRLIRALVRNYPRYVAMGSNVANKLQTGAGELAKNISALTKVLSGITLPAKLVKVSDVVELIIDFVGHKLGGKYKIGVSILMDILEAANAKKAIVDQITAVVNKVLPGGDSTGPNAVWRQMAKKHLEPKLRTFYVTSHDTLQKIMGYVGVHVGDPAKFSIKFAGDEFPGALPNDLTASAFGVHGPRSVRLPYSASDLAAGKELPPRLRATEETRFGQDLGHVRLHQNAASDRLLRPTGAQGLSTGSRIFLPRSTPVDMASGQRVLRHELGHVVHQAGSRPLGGQHPRTPHEGRPGRGLVYNPSAETAANRLAADATAGKTGRSAPASPDGFHPLPDFEGKLLEFINKMTQVQGAEKAAAKIDKTKGGTGSKLIDDDARAEAHRIVKGLKTQLKNSKNTATQTKSQFKKAVPKLTGHLTGSGWSKISKAVDDIAIESSKRARGKHKTGFVKMTLNRGVFKARLVNYILGATGILLDFKLEKARRKNKPAVRWVGIRYVYLPDQHGNSFIWKLVSKKDIALKGRVLTDVLRLRRFDLKVWKTEGALKSNEHFAFSDDLHKDIAELKANDTKTTSFAPNLLPSPKDYGDPTSTKVTPGAGTIGTRVSTYAEQKGTKKFAGKLRHGHHLPQYVLSEYVNSGQTNGKGKTLNPVGRRAFKIDIAKHPTAYEGLEPKNSGHNFTKFTGKKTIMLAKNEASRGGIMPAISLAAQTHEQGGLHITSKWADGPLASAATQADVVDAQFQERLSKPVKVAHAEAITGPFEDHQLKWETLWKSTGKAEFYDAMINIYGWARKRMLLQLENALKDYEIPYYNRIAAKDPARMSGDKLKDAHTLKWSHLKKAYEKITQDSATMPVA